MPKYVGRGKYKGYRPVKKPVVQSPSQIVSREYRPNTMTYNPSRWTQMENPAVTFPDERQQAVSDYGTRMVERLPNFMNVPGYGMIPNYTTPPGSGVAPYRPPNTTPTFYTKFGVAPAAPLYNPFDLGGRTATGTPHNVPWGAGVTPSETGVRYPKPTGTLTYTPPPDTGGSGGGGGGYYPYYGDGGGGYDYSSSGYSSPFSQYRQGYAAQGSAPQQGMGMRTGGQPQAYRSNYAVQNQQARWMQLLTNWRI